jgi:hypothetical protein
VRQEQDPARYGRVHEVPFEFRFVGINAVQWPMGRRVGHALRVCCACSLTARRRINLSTVFVKPSSRPVRFVFQFSSTSDRDDVQL